MKDTLTTVWHSQRHSCKVMTLGSLFERRHSYKVMAVFLKLQSYALGTDFSERHGIRRSLSENI